MEEKKIKIEIKNRFTGKILFEYEKVNNTVKETVIEAVSNHADLRDADLRDAFLRDADLRDAFLRDADLRDADLRGADLRGADLKGADLKGAFLGGADLRGAHLKGAFLRDADLRDAKNIPYIPLTCPSDGSFIGWKKVKGKLVKLEIPEDARRSSATGRKCRCDYARVLAIYDIEDNNKELEEVVNEDYVTTVYKVGYNVYPDSYDENRWNECSHGIHFFINKQEAIDY